MSDVEQIDLALLRVMRDRADHTLRGRRIARLDCAVPFVHPGLPPAFRAALVAGYISPEEHAEILIRLIDHYVASIDRSESVRAAVDAIFNQGVHPCGS